MRRVRQPYAVDRNIAREGVGRSRRGLDAPFWMFSRKAAHESHSRCKRHGPDPKPDQAITHIGWQLPFTPAAHRIWA